MSIPANPVRRRPGSLLDAIKMVTELAKLTYAITENGVEISRKKDGTGKKRDGAGEPSKRSPDLGGMPQRTYTIAPLAATALAEKTGGGADNEKIKQMFIKLGIAFPPGSAVTYLPSSRELVVRNSTENWEAIENCISQLFTTSDPIPPTTNSGRSIADAIAKGGWTPVFNDPAGGEAAVERKRAADARKIGAMSFSNENMAVIIHALSKRAGIVINVDEDAVAGFEKEWTSDTWSVGDVVECKSMTVNGEGDRIDVQIRKGRINLSTPESAKLAEVLRAIIQHTARNHGPNSLCLVYGANEIAVTSLGEAFGRIATTEHIPFDPALVEHGPVEDSQSPLADKRIYDVTLQGSTMQELLEDLGTKCGVAVELDRMFSGKLTFSMQRTSSGGSDALMTKIENGVVSCIVGKEGVRVVELLVDLCRDCGMAYVDAKPALYPYFQKDRVLLTRPSKDVYVKLVKAYADGCPSEVQFSADGKTVTIRSMPQVCRFAMQLAAGCRIASQE
jgi:hypothetical protein